MSYIEPKTKDDFATYVSKYPLCLLDHCWLEERQHLWSPGAFTLTSQSFEQLVQDFNSIMHENTLERMFKEILNKYHGKKLHASMCKSNRDILVDDTLTYECFANELIVPKEDYRADIELTVKELFDMTVQSLTP